MKRVYLLEVKQHNNIRYLGKAKGKDLVRLATRVEFNISQEAQRPIKRKRLEEISNFVNNYENTLSSSVVIGTIDDRISVKKVKNNEGIDYLYYIDFPETESEFKEYENSFDIMDGQHRLFSFLPEFYKLPDNEDFDLTFEMYIKPTIRNKRIIFKNTNEKQEKVTNNLLMWFRKKLNLLTPTEITYHETVELLNQENSSPLKDFIIMGSEKITGGFKAKQIINILSKSNISNMWTKPFENNELFYILSTYFLAWEHAVDSKIKDRNRNLGAFSKIAGFRFMILLLPEVFNYCINNKIHFDKKNLTDLLNKLTSQEGITPKDIFDKNSDYRIKISSNPFVGETLTTNFVKLWINKLKNLNSNFNPLNMNN